MKIASKASLFLIVLLFNQCALKVPVSVNSSCDKIDFNDYLFIMNDAALLVYRFAWDLDSLYTEKEGHLDLSNIYINFVTGNSKLIFYYDSIRYADGNIPDLSIKPAIFCDFSEEVPIEFEKYRINSKTNSLREGQQFEAEYNYDSGADTWRKFVLKNISQIPDSTNTFIE